MRTITIKEKTWEKIVTLTLEALHGIDAMHEQVDHPLLRRHVNRVLRLHSTVSKADAKAARTEEVENVVAIDARTRAIDDMIATHESALRALVGVSSIQAPAVEQAKQQIEKYVNGLRAVRNAADSGPQKEVSR